MIEERRRAEVKAAEGQHTTEDRGVCALPKLFELLVRVNGAKRRAWLRLRRRGQMCGRRVSQGQQGGVGGGVDVGANLLPSPVPADSR